MSGRHNQPLRVACHFGEWLQGRMTLNGPVVLVTLQPQGLFLQARRRECAQLSVALAGGGSGFPAPAAALRRFLRALDLSATGAFALRPALPPGLGSGASTAALIALARLSGFQGSPERLARACVLAEGASDPLMFHRPDRLLFASRQGKVLASLPPIPRAHLLAGCFGPALPTRATDQAYDDVSDLVTDWQRAQGLGALAGIASESAARCLARRGPADDPTARLARDLGALGWSASHSGAARTLIFAPGKVPASGEAALREAGLHKVRRLVTGGP